MSKLKHPLVGEGGGKHMSFECECGKPYTFVVTWNVRKEAVE